LSVKNSFVTVTDQFCGAGGSSLGAHKAGAEVRLALNHWRLAVETHNTNFPDTDHDCTDISACDPRRYPSTDILITSPECTNHSLAKGKKRQPYARDLLGNTLLDPAEERSRATMWDVPRFAEYHDYSLIVVENVVDAANWRLFDAWLGAMHALDYRHQIVYFNSMFAHPTPQSRDRMYVVFSKKGNPAPNLDFHPTAYCLKCERDVAGVQSWKKPGKPWGRYERQYVYRCPACASVVKPYYYAAANAIDWSLPAERIGDRRRPLKERTMERIRSGLAKFAGQAMLVATDYSHSDSQRARSALDALATQTSRQTQALVTPFLLPVNQSGERTRPVTDPHPTQTGSLGCAVVVPTIVTMRDTTRDHYPVEPTTHPLPTMVATCTQQWLLNVPFMVELRQNQDARETTEPLATVCAGGNHHGLVVPAPFLVSYYGTGGASGADEAVPTVTSLDRHGLVMPFFLGYANGDGPAHPVTDPLLTVHTENGHGLVAPSSPPAVEDCGFRMLQPREIGRAMAFPTDYKVLGNNRDQVRQYGNAVTPPVMEMILERAIATLAESRAA
jgi:DNA (cytosine-5)-methyltransferase 1